ncbi:cytosolic Fe-S cluster assembly factor Nbp35 [Mitosporidium daphniae]|uniref:Cytosolic Fe-S cluster assembly factor Nbp35 n=1 Tax=Mitosporidium daphniae TaxID=1485682 RepID=A0A098VNH3_9MICR|nr:cytosolic Fe-S cluster assembly factor Nbp35 [Mitosporidium daphniae]KGG50505.1 cytosolic Fe-S cluster assembly factor Nbp35 [Mitosporidium daphniae]|eukprot:XP_013236932.1 cytosolic Fe-S cluster assembly factor Nbp35 [Mitosporidium daphniae]
MSSLPHKAPGTTSTEAGKAESCQGCPNQTICASTTGGAEQDQGLFSHSNGVDLPLILENLAHVKNIILVLSGKGGNLSTKQVDVTNYKVGLLDLDICGPSIPIMTGTLGETLHVSGMGLEPISVLDTLSVISISYMLPSDELAVVWRGPKKNGLIKQFLKDVNWANSEEEALDYLIIDTPPGTSDEHISIAKLLKQENTSYTLSSIIISTPQVSIPILGLVENMSSFCCPSCKRQSGLFEQLEGSGCRILCKKMGLRFLGSIPIEPLIGKICDEGKVEMLKEDPAIYSIFQDIINATLESLSEVNKLMN